MNNNILINGFKELKIDLTEKQIDSLNKYCEFLIEYNKKVNLTRIDSVEDIYIKHYLDSIAPIPFLLKEKYLKSGSKCIDIGTGAGFPGIPIKIIYPDINISLAEVNKKKRSFYLNYFLSLN